MGYSYCTMILHMLYVLYIYVFIALKRSLTDDMDVFEITLWTLNIGYFVNELLERQDKGNSDYLSVAGWANYWDLTISVLWLCLLAVRIVSVFDDDVNWDPEGSVF